jgi:hypothetical protein
MPGVAYGRTMHARGPNGPCVDQSGVRCQSGVRRSWRRALGRATPARRIIGERIRPRNQRAYSDHPRPPRREGTNEGLAEGRVLVVAAGGAKGPVGVRVRVVPKLGVASRARAGGVAAAHLTMACVNGRSSREACKGRKEASERRGKHDDGHEDRAHEPRRRAEDARHTVTLHPSPTTRH